MIDIENKVFNDVAIYLRQKYNGISVYGEYVETPSSFPCVTIVQDDSSTYVGSLDERLTENHSNVVFSVNVYSNLSSGKKEQAKAIARDVDNILLGMKFTRMMMSQTPNVDRTIYRMTSRYQAVVGSGIEDENGDITYPIYRK